LAGVCIYYYVTAHKLYPKRIDILIFTLQWD